MKTFDWADLLDHHPIFSALNDKEVRELLQDEVSKERSYAAGTTILHAGEVGDSILLIGAGSLDAVLPMDGGKQINLSVMRKGEVFGEMGFFEERPRSATVIARESCMLLEIGGRDFRKTLEDHPEIEVKLLLTVSKRLRNANEQLLNLHLHGIDEKLQLFNAKLDVEHRIVDTSLRAA
ncbi:MAG TPA: cyclic nucleotide-binding domain-containing protein, partial [Aestuariivirgaceae bacterium]|nr:cyclic nucleotide-binding domain-containing protein [Aestuariivirgaceae bacterium]